MGRKCENYFMKIFLLAIELLCHQLVVKYSRLLCNFYFNFMNELLTTRRNNKVANSGRESRHFLDTAKNILMKIFSAWKVPHFETESCIFVGAVNVTIVM